MLTKQGSSLGKGARTESSRVREPRRTALPHGSQSYQFYGDGISFQVIFISQDGCQQEGFWEVVGHVVSPFDLSPTFPVGGGLLVPCSLPGSPLLKQLRQMVTMVPGQGGQFQSVSFP